MQITIDLPPDLEQDLIHQSAKFNVPLQTFILQALRQMIQVSTSRWSEVILSHEGISDSPPLSPIVTNSYRPLSRIYRLKIGDLRWIEDFRFSQPKRS